jgi:hypothetical protein
MLQAANAMVLLACDPEAQTQHPSTDLAAAAAAAVRSAVNGADNAGSRAGSSAISSRTVVTESGAFLPPLGSLPDDTVLQLIRGTPVAALRTWLQAESKCQCQDIPISAAGCSSRLWMPCLGPPYCTLIWLTSLEGSAAM